MTCRRRCIKFTLTRTSLGGDSFVHSTHTRTPRTVCGDRDLCVFVCFLRFSCFRKIVVCIHDRLLWSTLCSLFIETKLTVRHEVCGVWYQWASTGKGRYSFFSYKQWNRKWPNDTKNDTNICRDLPLCSFDNLVVSVEGKTITVTWYNNSGNDTYPIT